MIAPLMLLLTSMAIPPAPKTFVTDNAGLLSASTQTKLESELRDFQTKTGDQVVVWIGSTTGDSDLEAWTVDAAEAWKVGRKGKNNGVVLFVFSRDRKASINVGYGLESTLTDAQAAEIIDRTIAPEMKNGHPDAAVQDGVDAILHAIDAGHAAPMPQYTFNFWAAIGHAFHVFFYDIKLIVGGLILAFVIFYFVFGELVTWIRRGKTQGDWMDDFMTPIKKDQANARYGSGGGHYGGGGGAGGGGGFSGGGGSFGGGGASGGW